MAKRPEREPLVGDAVPRSEVSILIVDDEPAVRRALRRLLKDECDLFHEAGSGEDALTLARGSAVSLAVVDFRMPGINGGELLTLLRREGFNAPVILLSAEMDPAMDRTLRGLGASLCLSKSEMAGKLAGAVRSLLAQAAALGSTA
jgi:DNA-binding NarL/FixJ family response regulator